MLSILGELIVSRYVAELITTDAGRFGHVGLCQLRTKLLPPLPFLFLCVSSLLAHAPHVTTLSDCPNVFIHVCLHKCQLFIDEDTHRLSKHLNCCFRYSGYSFWQLSKMSRTYKTAGLLTLNLEHSIHTSIYLPSPATKTHQLQSTQ